MGGRNKSFTCNKRAFGSHCYLLSVISIGLGDGLTVLNIITDIEYIDSLLRGTDCHVTSSATTSSDQNQIYEF